jgi:2-polyprenyl-6-methoxyphenol hydroxylase-like FAD-dependent oxidoreductase
MAVHTRHGEHFDVVIAGGRVAGSALAVHLVRAGLSVLVLDRSDMPSDTPSTHTIQELSGLGRLGLFTALRETGAPVMMRTTLWIDDLDLSADHPALPRVSVRRVTLDELLADAARRAGADVRFGHKVVDVSRRDGRVCGLRYQGTDGAIRPATCSLVVGADGRSSTIARRVGARRYNVTWNERGAVWRYFSGMPSPAEFYFCRRDDALLLAAPCDEGLTMLAVQPGLAETPEFRAPGMIEESFLRHAAPWGDSDTGWDKLLAGAVPHGEPRMMLRYPCFFRESAGPGWTLLGDAGHVKDAVTGQGISDALRQAELLAEQIVAGWGADSSLDVALRRWWRNRDRRALPMYWLSQDMGLAGMTPAVYQAFFRQIAGSERLRGQLQQVLSQELPVRRLASAARFLAVTAGLLASRSAGVSEVWATARLDLARRGSGLRRHYEPSSLREPGMLTGGDGPDGVRAIRPMARLLGDGLDD